MATLNCHRGGLLGFADLDVWVLPNSSLAVDGLDILLLNSSFAGFGVADFRPRWIQYFVSTMQAFGLFRGRMSSSWPLPGQNVFLVFIQMYVPR